MNVFTGFSRIFVCLNSSVSCRIRADCAYGNRLEFSIHICCKAGHTENIRITEIHTFCHKGYVLKPVAISRISIKADIPSCGNFVSIVAGINHAIAVCVNC